MGQQSLTEMIAAFGSESKEKLAGVGESEEAIRVPIEHLGVMSRDVVSATRP